MQQGNAESSPGAFDFEAAPEPGTAASRYDLLANEKYTYLQRARQCARVTVPYLFPPQGHSFSTNYYTPFQSVGADCLNNLAAKLLNALFPPGEPFFKLSLSPAAIQGIVNKARDEQVPDDVRGKLEDSLSRAEELVVTELDAHGARAKQEEALKQLIVAGNVCILVRDDNTLLAYHLENYVVRRDVDGNPIEVILRDTLKKQSLPKEARDLLVKLERTNKIDPTTEEANAVDSAAADRAYTFDSGTIDLFHVFLLDEDGEKWDFHQELMATKIPGTDGTWPVDKPGIIPLTWYRIQGEHYGRGMTEHYLGDLNSLEALSQTMIEGAHIASQVRFIVDETGLTSQEDLANAPNGAFVNGEVADGQPKNVGVLKVDKTADFNYVQSLLDKITERLDRAFLRVQTRDAERVTAEEIRMLAKELEEVLGGTYGKLAQEFQRPLVRRVLLNMQKAKKLPKFGEDMVVPEIIAGLEGLGREAEMDKLDRLVAGIAEAFGPEAVAQNMNVGAYILRKGSALGIDMQGIVKTDQQKQEEAQAAAQQEMQKTNAPHMIKAGSDQMKSMREHPDSPVDQPGSAAQSSLQSMTAATGVAPTNAK